MTSPPTSSPLGPGPARRPLTPAVRNALLGLTLFLGVFPLTLRAPGWPAGLKSDEPSYYLMAESLAHDGDLVFDRGDLRRLFDRFPFHPVSNLILMSDDGWHTVYYGKPYLYSLFAAPWAAAFGPGGLIGCNMALLLAMVWMGTLHLRRYNSDAVAALFAAGFFLLSVGFGYVFWLHPEVFNMAAIAACLFLGLRHHDTGPTPDDAGRRGRHFVRLLGHPLLAAAGSGGALVFAAYSKPMLAAMGLGVLVAYLRRRRWRALLAWLVGAALAGGVVVAIAIALTGHATAYLGVSRGGFAVCSPHEMPVLPAAPAAPEAAATAATPPVGATSSPAKAPPTKAASWGWFFRVPPFDFAEVVERIGFFLVGRHTGLFLYLPFSLVALVLFVVHGRRSVSRWAVLASLAIVALVFLLFIPYNWHGGGGFLGNRYFVNVYPGFLFLVTRIAPSWLPLLGYLLAGTFLGPLLFTPLGRAVPWPTLQAHVRNTPFSRFPFEATLRNVPGYESTVMAGARMRGRDDVFVPQGNRVWLHGAKTVEVWIETVEPREELLFAVSSPAAPNAVTLRLGAAEERLEWQEGEAGQQRRVVIRPGAPTKVRDLRGGEVWVYRLEVTSATGEAVIWKRVRPPRDCFYYPYVDEIEEAFYVGAELTYYGEPGILERDVFALRWLDVEAPPRVASGESFTVRTRVRNTSGATWPSLAPAQVSLSYHWETPDGETVDFEGRRTSLPSDVPAGGEVTVEQLVVAPERPGRYRLALDAVFEGVAWFSRRGAPLRRLPVTVAAPGDRAPDDPSPETAGDAATAARNARPADAVTPSPGASPGVQ